MPLMRIFDWLFVNQLFGKNERGETVYYPHGLGGTGYLVPPEREASVRARVRWLALVALVGAFVLVVLVPRAIESWLGYTLPLPWFIGGALVAVVVIVGAIITRLSRLAAGLEPVTPSG